MRLGRGVLSTGRAVAHQEDRENDATDQCERHQGEQHRTRVVGHNRALARRGIAIRTRQRDRRKYNHDERYEICDDRFHPRTRIWAELIGCDQRGSDRVKRVWRTASLICQVHKRTFSGWTIPTASIIDQTLGSLGNQIQKEGGTPVAQSSTWRRISGQAAAFSVSIFLGCVPSTWMRTSFGTSSFGAGAVSSRTPSR